MEFFSLKSYSVVFNCTGETTAGDREDHRRLDFIKTVVHKLLYTENTTDVNKLKAHSKSFPLHSTREVEEVQLHLFLNSVLNARKWSVVRSGHFTPGIH